MTNASHDTGTCDNTLHSPRQFTTPFAFFQFQLQNVYVHTFPTLNSITHFLFSFSTHTVSAVKMANLSYLFSRRERHIHTQHSSDERCERMRDFRKALVGGWGIVQINTINLLTIVHTPRNWWFLMKFVDTIENWKIIGVSAFSEPLSKLIPTSRGV